MQNQDEIAICEAIRKDIASWTGKEIFVHEASPSDKEEGFIYALFYSAKDFGTYAAKLSEGSQYADFFIYYDEETKKYMMQRAVHDGGSFEEPPSIDYADGKMRNNLHEAVTDIIRNIISEKIYVLNESAAMADASNTRENENY